MQVLRNVASAHPRVLAEPPPVPIVMNFAESGIDLELGFWIKDPEAGTLNVRSDIGLIMWRAFKQAGIEIPYPQREVRLVGAANETPTSTLGP